MRICLVGHSLARDLGAYVQRDHPNVGIDDDILFIARGGLRVSEVVSYYDRINIFRPDVISLIIGENDLCENKHWTHTSDALMLAAVLRLAPSLFVPAIQFKYAGSKPIFI